MQPPNVSRAGPLLLRSVNVAQCCAMQPQPFSVRISLIISQSPRTAGAYSDPFACSAHVTCPSFTEPLSLFPPRRAHIV